MGARYSDRFFGREDGQPGDREASAGEAPARPTGDQFDLAGSSDSPAPSDVITAEDGGGARSPWYRGGAARAAVAAALVLGAAAGAYGWDSWRDHEVEVRAQATVDVSSVAFIETMGPGIDEMTVRVRLTNEGEHRLTVVALDAVDPRLTATDDAPDPVALAPADEYDQAVHLRVDCARRPPDRDTAAAAGPIVARLRTVDGSEHAEPVEVNGTGGIAGTFSEFLSGQCAYAVQQASSFGQFYALVEEGESSTSDTVAMTVGLQNGTGQPERPLIANVDARGEAFTAVWEPAVVQDRGAAGYAIGVVWRVRDCAAALIADDEDMEVMIDGQLADAETAATIFAEPSPGVSAELIRLAYRVCG